MIMFDNLGAIFLQEYYELVPKTKPVEEYDDRIKRYELYYRALFGRGYLSGAVSIMRPLNKKNGGRSEL